MLRQVALADHVVERLEGQVRVDGAGPVADQQREVMHLARLAALQHQADLGALALADQVVVDAGRRQQRRDRRQVAVHAAVGQDDEVAAVGHGGAGLAADLVHRPFQAGLAVLDGVQDRQRRRT